MQFKELHKFWAPLKKANLSEVFRYKEKWNKDMDENDWQIYTIDTIFKEITNKNLLYSSGNPTHCFVET